MSSSTIVFILERLFAHNAPRSCIALAFGPGLVAEAALFQQIEGKESNMKASIRLPVTFILAQSILLAFAIGEGYLLHWLLPSIELSTALFLALGASVAVIAIAVFVMTMMMMTRSSTVDAATEGQNETGKNHDDEDEDEPEMVEAKEQIKGELNRLLDPHLTEIYRREADRRRRRKR